MHRQIGSKSVGNSKVEWGKDLVGVGKYFLKNEYESIHVLAMNNWPDVALSEARAEPA